MYAPPRPRSYAPTPYSYTPHSALSATISLDEEVKHPSAAAERDLLDSLAEIYSIVVALDGLEKAFNKDSVTDAEYTDLCARLLKQYRSNLSDERVGREFGDLERFKARWGIECPRATERLRIGLPSTALTGGGGGGGGGDGTTPPTFRPTPPPSAPPAAAAPLGLLSVQSTIAATENFITFLDALKLGIASKDQLHPLLSEVITSVNKVTADRDFDGRASIIKWLIRLNGMRAHEELGDGDRRELEFDMEAAYRGFKAAMS